MKLRARCLATVVTVATLLTAYAGPSACAKEVYLGECKISAYCAATNTPAGSRATCTGHLATANHTIAVDMHDPLVSYGAKLRFKGSDTIYTVEDCGNLHRYGRDLDVYMDSYSEMEQWGVRWKKVYLVLPDDEPEQIEVPDYPYLTPEIETNIPKLPEEVELEMVKETIHDRYSEVVA